MNATFTVLVFAGVFTAIYQNVVDRRLAVMSGAALILVIGVATGFYSLTQVVDAIYFETLGLIFGMSAISTTLSRSGLFHLIARRIASLQSNGLALLVMLSLITYGLSLLTNNLATMVVIVPVTLTVCHGMKLNPIPILISEIIASNLGGASTMIGDFPNMIISSAGGLHFFDVLAAMMPVCLFLLAVLFWYVKSRRHEFERTTNDAKALELNEADFEDKKIDGRGMKVGLGILGLMLIGFLVSDGAGVMPGWIAVTGGLAALAFTYVSGQGRHAEPEENDWFASCGGHDIFFFASLFVMVGGLGASGFLDGVFTFMKTISGGHQLVMLLVLMWTAAALTIFLNAGAATAFFVPVAVSLQGGSADPTVWWALSLGVLAGSSAALTGATAGPVTASILERFVTAHPSMKETMASGTSTGRLDFQAYLKWGLPIMALFLVFSSLYIIAIAP